MAYQYDVNNVDGANGGAEVMYALKELLVANGWDVPRSGTGVAGSAADSDQFTGAADLNVSRAWFRLRAPATMTPRREFCIQRGSTSDRNWWIKVSAEDTFTLTAGDEDDMATASDEQNVWGSSTAGTQLFGVAATYKFHIGMDDASPFAFWCFAATNGTGATSGGFVFEPMGAGSYPSADEDPAVYYAGSSAAMFEDSQFGNATQGPVGWYKKDLAGEGWGNILGHTYYATGWAQAVPLNIGTNPYDSDDNHFPIPYARPTAAGSSVGWKGFGSQMRWMGANRAEMDTLSTAGTKNKICKGDVCLPWPNVVPSV